MKRMVAALFAAAAVLIIGVGSGTASVPLPAFAKAVKLTTDPVCGGYEPGMIVDGFGNIVITAHKDNQCDALAPDPNGTLPVRSRSWVWTSSDGVHFTDIPGLTSLGVDRMDFGDEGDLTTDDAGHIYFVDTNVVDNSFTRWKAIGNGKIVEEFTTPAMGTAQPVDDRPWITAHGNGVVMYLGNEGDKVSGLGGRYSIYMSYNAGSTFSNVGTVLPDSGWCRGAADHRPGSKTFYVFCTNDSGANDLTTNEGDAAHRVGTLWVYVSHDDGKTFSRHRVGSYNGNDNTGNTRNITFPEIHVDANGVVYAFTVNNDTSGHCKLCGQPISTGVKITGNHLLLWRSMDEGKTWQRKEISPFKGFYHYSCLSVMPDGRIGVAAYAAKNANSDWYAIAASAPSFDGQFSFDKVDPTHIALPKGIDSSALADLFQCAFGPDGHLNVAWEATLVDTGISTLKTDIYFSRALRATLRKIPIRQPRPLSKPVKRPAKLEVKGLRLANTGVGTDWWALAFIIGAGVFTLRLLRQTR